MIIGIPKEPAGQPLVAGSPDTVSKLIKLGYEVRVESGAGILASYPDELYAEKGAKIVDGAEVWTSDIVTCLDTPTDANLDRMRPGSTLIARLDPNTHPEIIEKCEDLKITALALDMVPRLSRAQSLDVRSSMMNVAGNRAVIEAAGEFGRLLTGQVTAAGKVAPAKVYVIGVGVAGLAAIGAAGSMGADVYATDVRSDVADQVESLGATFVEIPVSQDSADGYAKALSEDEQAEVLRVYTDQAAKSDIVITTAQVPGRPAPVLITEEAVANMKPGSIIVDMGASELGGNCTLSKPDETVVTENGVKIIGITDYSRLLPGQSSQLFGQNIVNLIKLVTPGKDGVMVLNEDDEVIRGMTVTLDGKIMWPPPPVKVSAAPAAPATPAAGSVAAGSVASVSAVSSVSAQGIAADETPAWRKWWWKVALVIVAALLIIFAPTEMRSHFIVFALAVVIGFYVITGVSHSLHTPLMSVTNAISGIIIVGAILLVGSSNPVIVVLSFIAMVIASINIFGGFLVTNRMLEMFQRSSEK